MPANRDARPRGPALEFCRRLAALAHSNRSRRSAIGSTHSGPTSCAATGVDNGYRCCGAIYLAHCASEATQLAHFARLAHARDVVADALTSSSVLEYEPHLRPSGELRAAYLVPEECQIRNPRHLKALAMACALGGVEITPGAAAHDFEIRGDRIRRVHSSVGPLAAAQICLTTGSWTAELARRLGVAPAIKPIRGQMVLLSGPRPVLGRIINEGSRYLVPRGDGRVLVGSTEEDAGFDRGTTAGAVAGLIEFATSLVPDLAQATIERTWAGLRPSTLDGLPYLGRVPHLENAFLAAGHFRSGLQLSTGTAVVMSQLMRGAANGVDLAPLRLDRDQPTAASERPARSHPQRIRLP